jgi:hypothetical protein
MGQVNAALLAALLAQAEAPEILVTGERRGRCRAQLASRTLGDRQFTAYAREWAALGTPVRVRRPPGATLRCLTRIVLRLHDAGVRVVHFVDNEPR